MGAAMTKEQIKNVQRQIKGEIHFLELACIDLDNVAAGNKPQEHLSDCVRTLGQTIRSLSEIAERVRL